MFTRLFVSCLAVAVGFAVLPVRSQGQSVNPPTGRMASVARYATGEFIAGCRVEPEPLHKHPYFGSLPIHRHFPEPLSLGRLHEMGVEELAVFCGPAAEEKPNGSGIEWAAAARFAKPVDLKTVMKAWRRSLVPQEDSGDPNPEPIRLGDYDCFRVPAGSFFPPPRKYGTLRFIDHEGQPAEEGVNVGDVYEYRGYVEGQSKAAAIFTLDGISETDVVEGRLPLEIRFAVFRTYNTGREFSMAEIALRNPETGLESEPIRLEGKSYVNRRLNIPRRLTSIDKNGKREADLLKDLVSDGKLEVVLKGTEPGIYIGVGAYDLNLRPRAFEFAFVNDRETVVAQTPETLKAMLQSSAKPVGLSERLSETGEIVIAAKVRHNEDRKALEQLTRLISEGPIAGHWGDSLAEMTGSVRLDQQPMAQLTAKFTDERSAAKAARLCRERIRELRTLAREVIDLGIDTVESKANLVALGLGVSLPFPRDDASTREQAIEEHEQRKTELLKVIDEVIGGIRAESEGNVLTIQFKRPGSLASLPKPAKLAWAKMDESLAHHLFEFEKFDLSDEVLARVTDRFPDESGAWFRRAWHLTYNTSIEFDGYEARYAWVRRGINVLLDGAEHNPNTTDLPFLAAQFISHKIGESDERAAFRELFSNDDKLHERLAKYIDLEKAKSPEEKIDNFLVAKLLFEDCLERHTKAGASSRISPLLFFSRPAQAQALYADSLGHNGRWDEARRAWKEAERLYEKLGKGKTGPSVEQFRAAEIVIGYDYWLTRCRFEQTDEMQSVRKLMFEADKHAKQSEWKPALAGYRQSLEILAKLEKRHPKDVALLAGDFKGLAKGYRDAQTQLELDEEGSLAPILNIIESPQSPFPFPLFLSPDDNPRNRDPM